MKLDPVVGGALVAGLAWLLTVAALVLLTGFVARLTVSKARPSELPQVIEQLRLFAQGLEGFLPPLMRRHHRTTGRWTEAGKDANSAATRKRGER
ncbi:hypothetical protein [Kitasatospora sp. NPDC057223]|uniref:hypothetical protein n=1 Tax=Kitasatospora sp. NPDC057223 TaxID=3346055 RepID=UPI003625E8C1